MPFFNWFPEFCFDVQLQCSHKDDVSINTECDNTLAFIFERGFVFGCYFCQSTFVAAQYDNAWWSGSFMAQASTCEAASEGTLVGGGINDMESVRWQ